MKQVVSVSLGTSKRNKESTFDLLGESVHAKRVGTDGDLGRFRQMFSDLDGKVDAIGVGGADIYVVVGKRRYAFRQILSIASLPKVTPVVDGSGLKHTLEREAVLWLNRGSPLRGKQVLMVSAVDRFGMAQALEEVGAIVTYGDLPFGVGVNLPLRSYGAVERFGRMVLPVVTRLPFKWFYPTGEKQEKRTPKYLALFAKAEIIAGDWHLIRRFAPDDLAGKMILTNTVRAADISWLRSAGASELITTTPAIDGETFATNVMEAAMVAVIGKSAPSEADYLEFLGRCGWVPNRINIS
jgi:hypothetical protein